MSTTRCTCLYCLLCMLPFYPSSLTAASSDEFNRTPGRFGQVLQTLQHRIRASNEIDDLEAAFWREEGVQKVDEGVRTRNLKGFDLQLEILRIRLNMPTDRPS